MEVVPFVVILCLLIAIVAGNPAKVIGFRFNPETTIENGKLLYPDGKRLKLELLENNYQKYFVKRLKEIQCFLK